MRYIEMSVDDAIKKCKKNAKILVAEQDLKSSDCNVVFVSKKGEECEEIFEDIKIVFSLYDDFINQMKLFTEKQDIRNVRPYGIQKTILYEKME